MRIGDRVRVSDPNRPEYYEPGIIDHLDHGGWVVVMLDTGREISVSGRTVELVGRKTPLTGESYDREHA